MSLEGDSEKDYKLSWGPGIAMGQDSLGHILGRTLTIIESLGLPSKQEEAVKGLIRQAVFADEERYVYIESDLFSAIKEAYINEGKKSDIAGTPHSLIKLVHIAGCGCGENDSCSNCDKSPR